MRPLWLVGALSFLSLGWYAPIWLGATWGEMKRELHDPRMRPVGHGLASLTPIYGWFRMRAHFAALNALLASAGRAPVVHPWLAAAALFLVSVPLAALGTFGVLLAALGAAGALDSLVTLIELEAAVSRLWPLGWLGPAALGLVVVRGQAGLNALHRGAGGGQRPRGWELGLLALAMSGSLLVLSTQLGLVGHPQSMTVVLEADLKSTPQEQRAGVLDEVSRIMKRRAVAGFYRGGGVESTVVGDQAWLTMELIGWGLGAPEDAFRLMGRRGQLEIHERRKVNGDDEWVVIKVQISNGLPAGLTTGHVQKAQALPDPLTNRAEIWLEFTPEGAELFEAITRQLLGRELGIVVDGELLTAASVQEVISTGRARISGSVTMSEGRALAAQLNAGAFPVPVRMFEARVN